VARRRAHQNVIEEVRMAAKASRFRQRAVTAAAVATPQCAQREPMASKAPRETSWPRS